MKSILFVLFVGGSFSIFSQPPDHDTCNVDSSKVSEEKFNNVFPEEILVKLSDSEREKEDSKNNMPWIVALSIGILSVIANFWVANQLRKSNKENIAKQLESNQGNIEKQIDNAKSIALSQFKANLAIKNRQDWIDELRNDLSEFISNSAMISVEMAAKNIDSEKVKPYFQKMNFCKAKINMLLNPDEKHPEQKKVMNLVNSLVAKSFKSEEEFNAKEFHEIENELLDASRALFGIHWEKIKRSFSE